MSDDDQKPKIFQLGTVPPPPGENDAYNAPTKVGPMAAQIQELINAATEEAERKLARERPPSLAPTTPPPLLSSTPAPSFPPASFPPASFPPNSYPPASVPNDGRLPSVIPEGEGESDRGAFEDETRIGAGAYAIIGDLPAPPSTPAATTKPPADAFAASVEPPAAVLAEAVEAPAPILPTPFERPLAEDVRPEVAESDPVSYSDPIAHTRPEWSSVSKSEPKLAVAAPATNGFHRVPLLIGILVVVFGIAGAALLIYGHR